MIGGHHVLEEVAIASRETLSFVVSPPSRLHGQSQRARVSAKGEQPSFSKGFSEHSLVLLGIGKHDKVCDGVSQEGECQLTD